jgi:hypothetical protein
MALIDIRTAVNEKMFLLEQKKNLVKNIGIILIILYGFIALAPSYAVHTILLFALYLAVIYYNNENEITELKKTYGL